MKQWQKEQALPIFLAVVTFGVLVFVIYGFSFLLNLLPFSDKIILHLRFQDVLVGLTIYLKTAIDFAIFIGNLMRSNPGVKKRIAIEIGTALGNGLGTILILGIWVLFKEVTILMVIMIFIASLVLLKMAEESLEEFLLQKQFRSDFLSTQFHVLLRLLSYSNRKAAPLIKFLTPNAPLTDMTPLSFGRLLLFSFSVPFILGLDDFAGYIPLFSVVNVFGFATGVFLGHLILTAALFISPKTTVEYVRKPSILLLGGLAFVGIAFWGVIESVHLLLELLIH
jgi:hypothetical protein